MGKLYEGGSVAARKNSRGSDLRCDSGPSAADLVLSKDFEKR
jgi:hypothetical protein